MEKLKRTYKNAGAQTQQGRLEALRFWDALDSDLFTVKGISLVLGINRNAVIQIPVQRIMIDKRGYYRKGDIQAWVELDGKAPDSLLLKLIHAQTEAKQKMRTQSARRYISGMINKEEAKQARKKTITNRHKAPDSVEAQRFPFLLSALMDAGKKPKKY